MKTPISYYGGKANLADHIVSLIPKHTHYVEPFCGGAAVFFAKKPSQIETLNDLNGELMNFYQVLKTQFEELYIEIDKTLNSRQLHSEATVVYNHPALFTKVKRAWAIWALSRMSFCSRFNDCFGVRKSASGSNLLVNKKTQFTREYTNRISAVCLECRDAIKVIETYDDKDSFFYCDPPYVGTSCGHYQGYTLDDYKSLLNCLEGIKGSFLLSSYPSSTLKEYIGKNRWMFQSIKLKVSVATTEQQKEKTEQLTANYDFKRYSDLVDLMKTSESTVDVNTMEVVMSG